MEEKLRCVYTRVYRGCSALEETVGTANEPPVSMKRNLGYYRCVHTQYFQLVAQGCQGNKPIRALHTSSAHCEYFIHVASGAIQWPSCICCVKP